MPSTSGWTGVSIHTNALLELKTAQSVLIGKVRRPITITETVRILSIAVTYGIDYVSAAIQLGIIKPDEKPDELPNGPVS